MSSLGRFTLLFLVFLISGLAPMHCKADPLTFSNVVALQNGTLIDLYSNPGITLVGPQFNFFVDVNGSLPSGSSDTLRVTYTEAGSSPIVQNFAIPLFGSLNPPFTQLITLTSPGLMNHAGPLTATLMIDLLNSAPDFSIPAGPNSQSVNSFTYTFNVAEPVPEPATLFLVAAGLFGVASRLRKRSRG